MLKNVIAAMLDEMFEYGLHIINEAEYMYDNTCIGKGIEPQYWDEFKLGDSIMGAAMDLGEKVGYNTYDTVWEDEVEYIR